MFKKISKQKDFEKIIKKGETINEDFLILKKIKNNLKESRIGIVVSKKVSNKAVIRNKIKRKMRETIRNKNIKPGYDIIFFTKKGISLSLLEENIEKILNKANLL